MRLQLRICLACFFVHCLRVCVCLCNICIDVKPNLFYFFSLLLAGGHSISLGLCPTKLPVKRDIQLGQLDVPAIRLWHGAKPRTTTTISYIHGRRNLNFFDVISYVVYMVIFMHVKGFSPDGSLKRSNLV